MNTTKDTMILITGANGFIGSRLGSMLGGLGYNIVNYAGDINNIQGMESYFMNVDIVIHLAAKIDDVRKGREKDNFMTVNVLGTQYVIDLCLKNNCKLLFFSSMTAVHPKGLYGFSKSICEQLIRFYGTQFGLRAFIIRPHNIYNEEKVNRAGRQVNLSRGHNYPLVRLFHDIENIIVKDKFSTKVQTYQTRLFLEHVVLYWPKRILNKFKRIV